MAVVGVGIHGSRYAEHLLRGDVPGATLAGVCRRDGAALAAWSARGVRTEPDAAALIDAPGVDAVVVASPPDLHGAHAALAFAAGKALLLEKPVASDGSAARAIAAAAGDVPVLVGHSLRYHPVCRAWRDAVRGMGRLRLLALSMRHEPMGQPWQMAQVHGGGALLTCAVHLADLVRWATGDGIDAVLAAHLDAAPGRAEGSAACLAGTGGGVPVLMDVSIDAPSRRGGVEAVGERGQVEGDYYAHRFLRRVGREALPVDVGPPVPGLIPLLRDFVTHARGGSRGDAASLDDGVAAVEFVDRVRGAATRGAYEPR